MQSIHDLARHLALRPSPAHHGALALTAPDDAPLSNAQAASWHAPRRVGALATLLRVLSAAVPLAASPSTTVAPIPPPSDSKAAAAHTRMLHAMQAEQARAHDAARILALALGALRGALRLGANCDFVLATKVRARVRVLAKRYPLGKSRACLLQGIA